MITAKVGYDFMGKLIPVCEMKFSNFTDANDWSTIQMFDYGYDSCEFFHDCGPETMEEIINEFLKTLE